MSAMVTTQPYTRQHASPTSRNLLNLDCSADLRSYRRDLGPGVQAKCFEKTSDTLRAQLDDHRAFLLRHRENGQTAGLPSPIPRLEIPQSHSMPGNNFAASPMTISNPKYHTASYPRPLQILSQPHAPRQVPPAFRPQRPVPGNINTYPIGLQRALEQCAKYGHEYDPNIAYEVVVEVASNYMEDSKDAVGSFESLQEANMQVAKVLLFDGYYGAGSDPTYEVEDDGSLRVNVMTDGSTGGDTTISVEAVSVKRYPGPKRR